MTSPACCRALAWVYPSALQTHAATSTVPRMEQEPMTPIDNRALDAAIAERALSTSFGSLLASEGTITVALDADGKLVEHHPDGTTRLLD